MSLRRDTTRPTDRRACPLRLESMEERVLLSTASPTVQARHQLVENLITTRRALHVTVATQRQERIAALRADRHARLYYGLVPPPPPTPRGLWSRGSFAYNTVTGGVKMTRSSPVIISGVDYAKRIVAPDTRKVASAYLGAIVHGNGKEINQLSHTDAVKTVKQEFINLGNSSNSKKIGNAFSKFGEGVAKQFRRVFGPAKSAPPAPRSAKA